MRRYFTITIVTSLGVLGVWRGWAGKTRVAAADGAPMNANMSAAESRYFNSQTNHWRQLMLRH
jgi:hypothetical protein